MFKYNNNHIFTGYLKQFLASFSLPTCKVYTREFAEYKERYGQEDPRVLESFNTISKDRLAVRINYLKNDTIYTYFSANPRLDQRTAIWKNNSDIFYTNNKTIRGLTRVLNSPGNSYDTVTHEYLGDYLRFLRDYYNINLMSLYNCFTDKICNNIYYSHNVKITNLSFDETKEVSDTNPKFIDSYRIFNSQDSNYRIYAIPVKLFSDYTIAIDCSQGIELFCGLYNTNLELSAKATDLASKTYQKIGKTLFKQPFLYDKLNVKYWTAEADFDSESGQIRTDVFTRWDIINREQDLRLFIKIPTSCKSSIVILEGDYRTFNDVKYLPVNYDNKTVWEYRQNHTILNFNNKKIIPTQNNTGDGIDLNNYHFKPISKLQLLAFNTGESYPFADRLVEYLTGSVITPMDEIPDNIKRAQRVMEQNKNYFKIEGLWENKMQNILYDYVINSGPVEVKEGKLVDRHSGINPRNYGGYYKKLGQTSKSTVYDILGYVDKDTEKWYASWQKNDKTTPASAQIKNTIQNIDIYDGLYDI